MREKLIYNEKNLHRLLLLFTAFIVRLDLLWQSILVNMVIFMAWASLLVLRTVLICYCYQLPINTNTTQHKQRKVCIKDIKYKRTLEILLAGTSSRTLNATVLSKHSAAH